MLFASTQKKISRATHTKLKIKIMADKAIKIAVLEGEFASLVGLGFPLSLSIQLQESCLTLSKALWTAKSTNSGFSVSLFWPAPDSVKDKHQPRRKRRKRRRAKATKLVPATTTVNDKPSLKPLSSSVKGASMPVAKEIPINATQGTATSPQTEHCGSSPTHHNVTERDPEKGRDSEEEEWTKVSCRRRKKVRLPPSWKLRVPVHLRASLQTPSESESASSTEGSSNESEADELPSPNTTPVAARTRSKLKT